MQPVTVTIPHLAAVNLVSILEHRLAEREHVATKFGLLWPDLADTAYRETVEALRAALAE